MALETMALETVAYVSEARRGFTAGELKAILRHGRAKNFRLGVCGYLVYDGEHFAQVLEGPAGPVAELLDNIERDERHHSLRVLCRERIDAPAFASSALGCVNLAVTASPDARELRCLLRSFMNVASQPLPTVRAFFGLFGDTARHDLAGLYM